MAHSEPSARHGRRPSDMQALRADIADLVRGLGFDAFGIADTELGEAAARMDRWLAEQRHGEMDWLARNREKRARPERLVPGTQRVISVRMDYLSESQHDAKALLDHPSKAYVSRYALGRDYHRVMRPRLQTLAERIVERAGAFGYRAFVDSAPVMEKPLAQKAGLGWIGKHTNLIDKDAGSWFFLGELFTDLPLPVDPPAEDHCGSCRACIDVCPTDAITAPYQLDARRCISYLTIEHHGDIPEPLRAPIGNRIYGCDDCQLFCPWNKFARPASEPDFAPRHGLADAELATLAHWREADWDAHMRGSAMRRVGFARWQRNLAVALGNAEPGEATTGALRHLAQQPSAQVRRHADWALRRHADRKPTTKDDR